MTRWLSLSLISTLSILCAIVQPMETGLNIGATDWASLAQVKLQITLDNDHITFITLKSEKGQENVVL